MESVRLKAPPSSGKSPLEALCRAFDTTDFQHAKVTSNSFPAQCAAVLDDCQLLTPRCPAPQDVATSLLLAEAVYKALDGLTGEQAVADISAAAAQLPAPLQQPLQLQWSLPHVNHRCGKPPFWLSASATDTEGRKEADAAAVTCLGRYLVAEGESAVYVALMGTKVRRDLATNAAILQELLWEEHRLSAEARPPCSRPA